MRSNHRQRIAIAAIERSGGLGFQGKIPWHSKEDLQLFKQRTSGHAVVMGGHTFKSLSGPLPYRQNIIVTREYAILNASIAEIYTPDRLYFVPNLDFDLKATVDKSLFYIGGTGIYQESLAWVDTLFLSRFDFTVECDTFFPLAQLATCGLEFAETTQVFGAKHNFIVETYHRPQPIPINQTHVFI